MNKLPHYKLLFIQRDTCKDGSAHLSTDIYKFFCTEAKLHYIIRAEYHKEGVFAIKFYCKRQKKSPYKYNKIINTHNYSSIIKILNTCILLVLELLKIKPHANFALYSARSIDFNNRLKLVEGLSENQRYRVYTNLIGKRIGTETFTHYNFPEYSSYLLVNNNTGNVTEKMNAIKQMFIATYSELPDI